MNCIIPGPNLKVFAKTLQALARIGDDLYVEATKEQLKLISLNLRKTVCIRCSLLEIFFSSYEIEEDGADNILVSYKIHMKTLLPIFKGTHLEKKLDYVKIEFQSKSDFLIFKMKYKCDEILMTHKLRLMEPETLNIDIASDTGCNNIITSSTLYNQLLNMFGNCDDEILFEITQHKAVVRNYYPGAPVRSNSVRSQVSLNGSEFSTFRIEEETTVNFSLKPFKTAINFAETFNLNITLNFEKGGQPLSIVIKNPTFEVNFIVATLNPNSDNQSTVSASIPAKITQINNNQGNITAADQEALLNEDWDDLSFGHNKLPIKRINKNNKNQKGYLDMLNESNSCKPNSNSSLSKVTNIRDITVGAEIPVEQDMDIAENPSGHVDRLNDSNSCRPNSNYSFSKVTNNRDITVGAEIPMEQDLDTTENSPESPRTKKIKLVFSRCLESTFCRDQLGEVLAENSDPE